MINICSFLKHIFDEIQTNENWVRPLKEIIFIKIDVLVMSAFSSFP